MDTTRHQPIVDTAMEMWTLTSYLAAMGMVVLYYDCLLTINDEVWPGFSYLCTSLSCHLFYGTPDSPCLARTPLPPKGAVLHYSVSTCRVLDIRQLPSVLCLPTRVEALKCLL